MSKPGKQAETDKLEKLSFEDALGKLEAIVEAMESGDLPLETLLHRYEEGMKLAQACQARIADAEVRIQQLEKTAQGAFALKPLTTETTAE
jgi:exodeoxyribonuclease VII small subunit